MTLPATSPKAREIARWRMNFRIFYLVLYGLKQIEAAKLHNITRERARQIINILKPHQEFLSKFVERKTLGEVLYLLRNPITIESLIKRIENERSKLNKK